LGRKRKTTNVLFLESVDERTYNNVHLRYVVRVKVVHHTGFHVIPEGFPAYVCRALLLFASFDSVAKPVVMNIKSFNSRDPTGGGCPVCKHPGQEEGNRTVYCWQHDPSPLRNHDQILDYIFSSEYLKKTQPSIKG
jgi:hypothetical protein